MMTPLKSLLILGSIQCAICYTCPAGAPTKYPDRFDPDCKRYIICDSVTSTVNEAVMRTCPGTTKFNPGKNICEDGFVCANPPACTAAGRFPNNSVPGCKGYRLCVLNDDQTYKDYHFVCPDMSVFSPAAQSCSTTYKCVEVAV